MKHHFKIWLVIVGLTFIWACSDASQAESSSSKLTQQSNASVQSKEEKFMQKNILVAYFSHTGNTAAVARQIANKTGGDLYEIIPQKPYPTAYNQLLEQAKNEIRSGFHPPLQQPLPDLSSYDIVFVGSPNWWGTYTPAVGAFLAQYDWKGKKVVAFFTHGGGGMQNCARDIQQQLSGAEVAQAAAFRGNAGGADQNELSVWLGKLEW